MVAIDSVAVIIGSSYFGGDTWFSGLSWLAAISRAAVAAAIGIYLTSR
jgi:hypothetical protein